MVKTKLLLILINIFLSVIVEAQNDDIVEKKDIKIPYSWQPSFINIGFDIWQFAKHLIANHTTSNNYDLDFRGIFSIDFNKILLDTNGGILFTKVYENNQEHSVFLKTNVLWNILKKNSNHDMFFLGGGININGTRMKIAKKDENNGKIGNRSKNKFAWGWLNFSLGIRKTVFKWFFFGLTYTFNLFKKELYTRAEKDISQERIYAWGDEKSGVTHYLSIYIGTVINLGTEDERVKDDEYYFDIEI